MSPLAEPLAARPQAERQMGDVLSLASDERRLHLRMIEAMLFASAEPLAEADLAMRMPAEAEVGALVLELQSAYAGRGVNLRRTDGRWAFCTAEDLAGLFRREVVEQKKLSRAAVETLAIIAYHQPVTRADIEAIRGVAISKGSLDVLLEAGWIRLRGRRRTPGRPVTFGTTPGFLIHFGLDAIGDLPGVGELKAAGLLDLASPAHPAQVADDDEDDLAADGDLLAVDEDPLESGDCLGEPDRDDRDRDA